jgi:hypothetical protein
MLTVRFADSERAYTAIAAAEPDCAMAYWGIAMSRPKRPVAQVPATDDILAGCARAPCTDDA